MNSEIIVALGCIGFFSLLSQLLAWRMRIPSILLLLISGIVLGPVFRIVKPDEIFGHLLNPIVSIAVAIILFEGSLSLNFREIFGFKTAIFRLMTLGVIISWVLTSAAIYIFAHLEPLISILLGSILIVTGPTVIKPLLSVVRPEKTVANILKWEGIILDPLGGLLAVIVYSFIISQNQQQPLLSSGILQFALVLTIGVVCGLFNGFLIKKVLIKIWLPNALKNFLVLNWVVLAYIVANAISEEAGLVTVTIMGIILANQSEYSTEPLLEFKESVTIFLLSGLFIVLAAKLDFKGSEIAFIDAMIIVAWMQLVIQPLKVFITLMGSTLNWRQKLLISWMSPRGIVAAALVSLFAFQLNNQHTSSQLIDLVFYIILINVALISLTSKFLASKLNLCLPNSSGILFAGANAVARAIAEAVSEQGTDVILADSNWEHISAARYQGLPVYFGNPISDEAEHKLDLTGIGRIMSMTPNSDYNLLVSSRYYHRFGSNSIFHLRTTNQKNTNERHSVAKKYQSLPLFGDDITYQKLASLFAKGADIRCVKLTDTFNFEEFTKLHSGKSILLFYFSNKQGLKPIVNGENHINQSDAIIYLYFEDGV